MVAYLGDILESTKGIEIKLDFNETKYRKQKP